MLKFASIQLRMVCLYGILFSAISNLNAQDVTPPQVSFRSPSNAATEVRLNQTNFYIEFNENVKYVSGQWRIVKTATDEVIKSVTPFGSSHFRSWQNVDFPNGLLEPGTAYHIEIDAGTYEDEAGNDFAGYVDNTSWTFTSEIAETDLPLISSLSPLDNSTNVSIAQRYFNINFNEDVRPISGDWRLINSDTDEVIKTVSLSASDSYSGSMGVWFNNDLLEPSTEYYLEVDAGAYQDVFGNAFAGIDEKTTWSFTTQASEAIAPEVSNLSPTHNSTDISLNQRSFSITFDEQVTPVSGSWRLVETGTGTVVKTVNLSTSNSYDSWWSVYFSAGLLSPGTNYHIEVTAGSYQDLFGNTFAGITSGQWSFTTQEAETIAPVTTGFDPANGSTGIGIGRTHFNIFFDEPVRTAGGEVRLIKTSTGETIKSQAVSSGTFYGSSRGFGFPSGLLEASTQYHIEVDAGTYEDIFGNAFAGISDGTEWSFTTMDPETDAPLISQFRPSHEATAVEVTENFFSVTFNEDVTTGSGQWRLVKTATDEVVKTQNVTSNSNYDSYWSINFTAEILEPSTQYHIEMDAGTYKDVFGNNFAGISDETTWSFTTQEAETDPPAITSLSPSHNATGVSIGQTYFRINFDENVTRIAGEWRLIKTSTDETVKTATFSTNENFRNWHTVFFSNEILEASTQYHIEINAGIYTDVFGNDFAGISDETTWSFTTQDPETDPPVLTSQSPSDNSTGVSLDQTYFALIFNEAVTHTSGNAYLVNAATKETVKTTQLLSVGLDTWQYFYFPEGFMEPGTEYYILVDADSYEDVFGNKFAGIDDETTWSFTTQEEEFDAPIIESFNPSHQSTNIDITTTYFSVRFNEGVKHIKGDWQLVESQTGEIIKTFTPYFSSAFNNFFGISFPEGLLKPSTNYHLQIQQGAFQDIFGNEFAGITSQDTWSFTTQAAETDPPTLTSFTPQHNATDQDLVGLSFTMEFNEKVQYVKGVVYLIETAADKIIKTAVPSNGGYGSYRSFDFIDSPLKPNTKYHIEMDAGIYTDLFGNDFAGIADETVWSFTTKPAEANAPIIDELFPEHNSTDISINQTYFSIGFDELVKYEGGVLRLVKTATDEIIKYATPAYSGEYGERVEFYFPQGLLEASTQYHLELDGDVLSDFFDNYFGGIADETIWSFTTQADETTAPQIISSSPSDGEMNVSTYRSYFYVNFDEPVAYGDGEIRLIRTDTDEVLQRIVTRAESVYSSGKSINFNNLGLVSFTDYHIEIDEGTFIDVFNNSFGGFDDKTTWNFKTRDLESPVFSSSSLVYVEENTTTTGYTAVATDGNGVVYSFSGDGEDDDLFDINSGTGVIDFKTAPDFESPHDDNGDNGYIVEIVARDNRGNITRMTLAIVVRDKDEINPVVSSELELSFEENNQSIAYLPSVIDDSEITFSLSATGADSDLFEINTNTGEISFKVSPDFEAPTDSNGDNIYEASLAVTDDAGNSVEVMVKITVTDVDENAPVFSSASSTTFTENATGLAYKAIATDENSITYKLSGQGADDALFTIDAESGEVYFIASPNYEIPSDANKDNSYSIEITATDDLGNNAGLSVTINVGNEIESLTFISSASVSVDENTSNAYSAVATADGTITYAINAQGADDDLFGIDATTGEVTFNTAPDYENPHDSDQNNVYELSLIASDGDGNSVTLTVEITITDIDENIPVFVSDASVTVAENVTGAVYQAVATDQSALTYSLSGDGADNDLFEISGNTGKVTFKTSPDYEAPHDTDQNNEYDISVVVTDEDGFSATQLITVIVTDFDEANPVFISEANVDFLENKVGVAYQAIATDENEVSYEFTGAGADESLFTIEAKTGKVSYIDPPDYEAPQDGNLDNVYEVEIKASDALGYTASFGVSIAVIGENDNAPTADRVDFTGELVVDQILVGAYEFYDLDGNEEDGTTVQWYRSADGTLDELTPIENANELTYQTTDQDEFSYLVLEVIPNDGLLQGSSYFSTSKYISSRVLDVEPNQSSIRIMDLGTGAIRVKFASYANREILVYSLEGKVERKEHIKEDTLDIEYLKPGVWVLKYAEQNGIFETLKFIVD